MKTDKPEKPRTADDIGRDIAAAQARLTAANDAHKDVGKRFQAYEAQTNKLIDTYLRRTFKPYTELQAAREKAVKRQAELQAEVTKETQAILAFASELAQATKPEPATAPADDAPPNPDGSPAEPTPAEAAEAPTFEP